MTPPTGPADVDLRRQIIRTVSRVGFITTAALAEQLDVDVDEVNTELQRMLRARLVRLTTAGTTWYLRSQPELTMPIPPTTKEQRTA